MHVPIVMGLCIVATRFVSAGEYCHQLEKLVIGSVPTIRLQKE